MKLIICFAAALSVSILLAAAFTLYFLGLPSSFFDFNLMQLITPIVQVAIAVGLALFVNVKLSNKSKRSELLVSKLEDFEALIGKLHGYATEYMETKKTDLEPNILRALKDASKMVYLFKKIGKNFDFKFSYIPDEMEKDLLDYKRSLTKKSFKQKIPYDGSQKREVDEIKRRIDERITFQKLSLYA